jgi:AraC-like DNA-binding protein
MNDAIVSPLAPLFLARLRDAGGDVRALCRRLGLPEGAADEREVTLTIPSLRALCDEAARVTGDPFLGLHLATDYRRGTYGVLELAGASAPDLRAAFARLVRYIRLINPTAAFTLTVDGLEARVDHRLGGGRPDLGRHMQEAFVAILVEIGRRISGGRFTALRVWFAHRRPERTDELERFFGCALAFDRETNGLVFPAAQLELPCVTADPTLLPILDRHAHLLLDALPAAAPADLVERLRAQLRATLGHGDPSADHAAAGLRLSRRTLQRRLAERGTSFQQVLDEVRAELARRYLDDPRLSLGEIAFLLGYSELRPFLRAFKRWTGTTPGQMRK